MNRSHSSAASGVFLVAPGGRMGAAATALAELCQLRLLPAWEGDLLDRNPSFQALTAEPPGWIQPLALDPGQTLSGFDCWAEALGAWRIPSCLVCSEADRAAGLARSHWALLRHYRVPLLGLIQVGGDWRPAERRAEGLPWLGHLPTSSGDQEALAELRLRFIAASGAAAAAPPAPASKPSH
ncbi:hypothetical protein MY494_04200 [Synechococcus sp. A10-1-5-1]|uniref:hypothetical protein n=1 Tax=Synechococcus sp. A10-1-5-1 TaxID=2936507 RepID=UPI0020014F42|nr:hypothetical protein [Synechococcus sp. A10-1-5-1]UPM50988.1 hypothetical protein MY494_04200 [Synechococcus sp. A10-1-5-1]